MDTTDVILRATNQRSVRSLATQIGMAPATLTRQLREGSIQLPTMLAICRTFGVDLIDLLIQTGHISVHEAHLFRQHRGLESYSDLELVGEMYRRAATGAALMPRTA